MVSTEATYEYIKNKGDFDALKHKVLEELRKHDDFRKAVADKVARSRAVRKVDLERMDKKQLLLDVRKEIENELQVLAEDIISKMMHDPSSDVHRAIEERVAAAFSTLAQQDGHGH